MRYANACLSSFILLGAAAAHAQENDQAIQPPPTAVTPADTFEDFHSLLAAFAKIRGFSARFDEKRSIDLLLEPLESSGMIYFDAHESRLARHTEQPFPAVLVVAPNWIGLLEDFAWEEVELDHNPAIAQLVASFMKVLSGDSKSLEQLYRIDFTPKSEAASGWQMLLEPRLAPLDKIIRSVRLSGTGLRIAEMHVVEVCGDETVSIFSAYQLNRTFSAKERAVFFPSPRDRGHAK